MRSVLVYPQSYSEWERSIGQVGHEGVVGSVMPEDHARDCRTDTAKLHRAAETVAKIALGDAFTSLYRQTTGHNDLGLHVDIAQDRPYGSSIPELALWSLKQGSARWLLKDTGSRDLAKIDEAFTDVEQLTRLPKTNGYGIKPEARDTFAQVVFEDYGVLVFPPGLQHDRASNRQPAMHQVESITPRKSITLYGERL